MMHLYMYICIFMYVLYIYMYIYIYIYTCICLCVCEYPCTPHKGCIRTQLHTNMYTHFTYISQMLHMTLEADGEQMAQTRE